MKIIGKMFLASAFIMLLFVSALLANTGDDPKGKTVFESSKCNNCHSVEALKIEKTGKMKAPDLSNAGAFKQDFLEKFLQKKEEIEGKKHPAAFKGTDADLKELTKWLSSQKTKEKSEK